MSNQVNVNFKVTGGDLEAYMANVQKKSATIANDAIKAAITQTDKGKELLDITNKQIQALERKNRLESQGNQAYLRQKYEGFQGDITNNYTGLREKALAGHKAGKTSLSQYSERLATLNEYEANDKSANKEKFKSIISSLGVEDKEKKLQTSLAKEQIEAIRQTAKENVKAINSGDLKLVDVIRNASTDEEKLVSKLTQEGVAKEKKLMGRDGSGPGVLSSLLTLDNLQRFVTTASQLAQTQNGFDAIGSTGRAISQVVGSVIGGAIGSLVPGGTLPGASIGGSIANLIGGTSADFLQRQAIAKQENLKASFRYSATTGGEAGTFDDMSGVGIGATDYLQKRLEYAKRRGNSASSNKTAVDALYAERGLGIDGGTSAGLIEILRSQKENNRDLANLIGGVLQKGSGTYFKNADTTFLGEFLSRFTVLQKDLLKTNSTMGTAGTYDILSRFNSLGGEFSTSDPRSGGLISTINSSLANPGSDFKKALSFYALKKNNPNMSIADLIETQQGGLGSKNYLSSMMDLVSGMGGDESSKRMNFAGMLGLEGNQAFASNIYSGYRSGKFKGGFASGELSGSFDFKSRAEGNTSPIDKGAADIQNKLLGDATGAVSAMVSAIQNGVENALSGSTIELNNGKIIIASRAVIQQNATRAAKEQKRLDAIPTWQMQDHLDAQRTGGVHHK